MNNKRKTEITKERKKTQNDRNKETKEELNLKK